MTPDASLAAADKSFLEALPAALYFTDPAGCVTFYNAAAAKFWGFRPELGVPLDAGDWRLLNLNRTPVLAGQDPLALTLKTGTALRDVDMIAIRRDGTEVRFLSYPNVVRDADGAIVGGVNVMIDVSDRSHAEADAERLAAIVASSDDAIVSKTLDGYVTSWNRGATQIFGYTDTEMIGQHIKKIIPPELHAEEDSVLARLRRGEHIEHFETVRVTKDGRRVDVSLTVSPLRDKTGRVIGASKVGRDVTARKEAERTQALLVGELSHRVKNTLATVQAIATLSLRRSPDPREFVTSFSGRIQSLSKAHDLLSETHWEGVSLEALIREQVLLGMSDARVTWSGPAVQLDAQPGLHLALVLHELGTNARKYGGLSVPTGKLEITWQAIQADSGRELRLQWQESDGPTPVAPSARGFGTTLIEGSLAAHGGSVAVEYGATGVSCQLVLPLAPLATRAYTNALAGSSADRSRSLPPQPLAGRRVIVVDDEPLIAMEIVATLTEAGCEVVGPTASIDRAIELLASGCDAALIDANIAGEPVDRLPEALTKAGVPFAFVTGYGVEDLPQAWRHTPIVPKPFTPDQILAAVRRLLEPRSDPKVHQLGGLSRPAG
jgi:PAS domain S-box-containing protein